MVAGIIRDREKRLKTIRSALEASDPGTAERLAHTLKGVSGNIGATMVQKAAEKVEKAIRAGDHADTLIDDLERPLSEVVHGLKTLADEQEPRAPATVAVPGRVTGAVVHTHEPSAKL